MAKISEGERIIKLMLFVRENGPVSLAAIRDHFPFEYGERAGNEQATRRLFERDKKTLQDYGVFLVVDGQQRYALDMDKSFAAPLSLTQSQVSLLRLLCGALLEDEEYPFKEDLRMVLVKLGDELEVPDMLPQMAGSAHNLDRCAEPQGFAKIRKAISNRKRLGFKYSDAAGNQSMREVEPFGCFFLKGQCYVVAFDPAADGIRRFRADRMSKIRVNAASPGTPDFEERLFEASEYYGLPFQFGNEDCLARICFEEGRMAEMQALSMNQGRFEWDDSGPVWVVRCRDTKALARWCIENAPYARIIEPAEAIRAYKDGLESFLMRLDEAREEAEA